MTAMQILQAKAALRASIQKWPAALPVSKPAEVVFQQKAQTSEHFQYAEIKRICGLPFRQPMEPEELEEYNRMNVMAEAMEDGWRLFPLQAEATYDYETEAGLFAPLGVGCGKCVLADTEVWDQTKGRCTVDGEVSNPLSMEADTGKSLFETGKSFFSGYKECVRLYLKSGQNVGLSTDHPVLTHRGWVRAGELVATDLIATPRHVPEPAGLVEVSDAEVRVIAALLANGGLTNNQCSLSDEAGALVNEFAQDVKALGGEADMLPSKSKALDIHVRGLLPFVRRWGLQNTLSKYKRVPGIFYNLPQEQVALFVNRFWAADGHINVKHGILECTLASEGLIKDLQFLLLRLGVLSRYRYKKSSYVKEEKRKVFDSWKLTVTGKRNIWKFFAVVKPLLGQETASRKLVDKFMGKRPNTNTDIVPIGRKEIQQICDELEYPKRGGDPSLRRGSPRSDLRKRLGATQGQYISRFAFASWVCESGYNGTYAWLAKSDIAWERLESVKPLGVQPVYDLTVPATQSFVGNGIVLHNTLVTLMIANKAYQKGVQRILLLVPSQVLIQLVQSDIKWARTKVPITYPIHVLGGRPMGSRRAISRSSKRGL